MSADIKLSKAQRSKIIQFDFKPLAESVLIALGLTAAASAADAGIQKKICGSGTTTLVISDERINDIMKILQALEDSGILLKGVSETIKNETKNNLVAFCQCY